MTAKELNEGIVRLSRCYDKLNESSLKAAEELYVCLEKFSSRYGSVVTIWGEYGGEWYCMEYQSNSYQKLLYVRGKVFLYKDSSREIKPGEVDETEVITILTDCVREVIELVKEGKYVDWIKENIDRSYLTGKLILSENAEEYEKVLGITPMELSDKECQEFSSRKSERYVISEQIYYSQMTAKKYFHIYALIAKAIGFEDIDGLSDKEIFFKYFAGKREEYLKDMNDENAQFFTEWYDSYKRGGNIYYSLKGYNDVPVIMDFCQDEAGYFVKLLCNCSKGLNGFVRAYNALIAEGFPVWIENPEKLLEWIDGKCIVGILPEYLDMKEESYVFGATSFLAGCVRYADIPEKLKGNIKWNSIYNPQLKEK